MVLCYRKSWFWWLDTWMDWCPCMLARTKTPGTQGKGEPGKEAKRPVGSIPSGTVVELFHISCPKLCKETTSEQEAVIQYAYVWMCALWLELSQPYTPTHRRTHTKEKEIKREMCHPSMYLISWEQEQSALVLVISQPSGHAQNLVGELVNWPFLSMLNVFWLKEGPRDTK